MNNVSLHTALRLAPMLGLLLIVTASIAATRIQSQTGSQRSAPEIFSQNCAKCHGKDGQAKGFKAKIAGVRNLTDAKWQENVTDERIFNSIANGKGKMPAFSKKFSDQEIESLVAYVRTLRK